MNRIALLLLFVATLVGCSGGTKSAPNTPDPDPDPEPDVPTPSTDIPDRHPHQVDGQGAGPSASANEPSTGDSVLDPVDWIELRTPPFQHGETEFFLVHLASPCDSITWLTTSMDYVGSVRSDQGYTYYDQVNVGPDTSYRTSITQAGKKLSFRTWGYQDVIVECWIRRGETETFVRSTCFPRFAPPRSEGILHWGIMGVSGQEQLWSSHYEDHYADIQWEFGDGSSPNSWQGPAPLTVSGPPGHYSGSYAIRNEEGFSGPQPFDYWIQPPLPTYPLNVGLSSAPSLLVVNNRIRLLLTTSSECLYGEALIAEPQSAADWRFYELPLPTTHQLRMQMGFHAGHLLVVGGLGESAGQEVLLYYRASVPSPLNAADWDVGGIPESDGMDVIDVEFDAGMVGLLVRQSDNLALLWDATSTLSQWQFSEVVHNPTPYQYDSNRLLLTETGPAVVGYNLRSSEPSGLMYRSATGDAAATWSAHCILPLEPDTFSQSHVAAIYQGRPLVLGCLDWYSSVLLWSAVPRPMSPAQWERLETSRVILPTGSPVYASIDVAGDRLVMNSVKIRQAIGDGTNSMSTGGLLVTGDPADPAQWSPFLAGQWPKLEGIRATVLTNDGVGVLSAGSDGLHFGMLSP